MVALVFAAALIAASAVPPAGTYRYDAASGQKTVGSCTITVLAVGNGVLIEEHSVAHLPTGDSGAHSFLTLDRDLRPTRYVADYAVQDQKMQTKVDFAQGLARVVTGAQSKDFPLGGSSRAFVVLDATMMSGFFMLPAQASALAFGDATALVPGLAAATYINLIPENVPARPREVSARDASISFAGETPFVEWYDPVTNVVDEVSIPGQDLTVRRKR
ncbi:MAG: hypothetical protein NVS1B14_02410 [Vulcanimicrobiaceae bacterium]